MIEEFSLQPLSEIEELNIKEEHKLPFEKYVEKCLVLEQYEFFLLYQKYLKNFENEKEKEKLQEELYQKYINQDSKSALTLHVKIQKKVKNLYEEKSTKPFQIVFQEVCFFFFFIKN